MARRKDALNEDVVEPVVGEAEMLGSNPAPGDPLQPDLATPVSVTEAPTIVRPAPPPRRSGILGPLLGGALAAIGGFALSHFNVFGLAAPDQTTAVAALGDRVAAIETAGSDTSATDAVRAEIGTLAERVEVLESVPPAAAPDLSGLEERLAAIEALPEGGDASTAALAAKLAELERRLADQPAGVDQTEVNAALERLAAAEAEAKARADEAAAAAEVALRAEAMGRLRDAVAAGGGVRDGIGGGR